MLNQFTGTCMIKFVSFYPRALLAIGCCHCLRLCVCVCQFVCLSLACPHDNLGPVQNILIKASIVLGSNRPLPSKPNLTQKSNFTPLWACPHFNSSLIQARITKFGPEVYNHLVKILVVCGGDWPWPSRWNVILKGKFSGLATTWNT